MCGASGPLDAAALSSSTGRRRRRSSSSSSSSSIECTILSIVTRASESFHHDYNRQPDIIIVQLWFYKTVI